MLKAPLESALAEPKTVLPKKTLTVAPASAVPVIMIALELVTPSVAKRPVSLTSFSPAGLSVLVSIDTFADSPKTLALPARSIARAFSV